MDSRRWYQLAPDDVLRAVDSGPDGLTPEEARRRLERDGPNELEEEERDPWWRLLLEQFVNPLVGILIAAAIVSFATGEHVEGATIVVIVVLAALLGFLQEWKAEAAMKELRKLTAPRALVIRGGREVAVAGYEVVKGDLVPLAAGEVVPADCRLLEVWELRTDEKVLTGESTPVEKTAAAIPHEDLPVADRTNMAHAGTAAVHGRARAVVVATAHETEFGRIAELLASQKADRTPLQRDLDHLGRILGIGSLVLAGLVALLGIVKGFPVLEMFIWGVSLAVAVVPEALPAVVTISLALAVKRLVDKKSLVRRLPAVETLGSTNVICSDKTGTLTTGQMTVRRLVLADGVYEVSGVGLETTGEFRRLGTTEVVDVRSDGAVRLLLTGGVLCNDAEVRSGEMRGDPVEGALVVAARKAGLDDEAERRSHPRTGEVAFSSERKRMATIHGSGAARVAYVKGAPETILSLSTHVRDGAAVRPLDEATRRLLEERVSEMNEVALRGLAVALREVGEVGPADGLERDLVWLGCFGLIDPPRPEARAAVETARQAGIETVMITGDHLVTAQAVARELGILTTGLAVTGTELQSMSDATLDERVESIQVYARVDPAHKLRIVESYKRRGKVVAMTGDGVNDAPALKRADIGIAMGLSGTGVSREASAMILTDDNFASIVDAVAEGRRTYDNIRKYLVFLLSGNMGAILAMVAALLLDYPPPLAAVQVLFINMILDGLPAIALSMEAPESGVMSRKPRNRSKPILDLEAAVMIFGAGALVALVTFSMFVAHDPPRMGTFDSAAGPPDGLKKAMTVFFATLVLSRLFNGLNCRSFADSAFSSKLFGNVWLAYGIGTASGLTLLAIHFPPLAAVLDLRSLSAAEWVHIAGAASLTLLGVEGAKFVRRRRGLV